MAGWSDVLSGFGGLMTQGLFGPENPIPPVNWAEAYRGIGGTDLQGGQPAFAPNFGNPFTNVMGSHIASGQYQSYNPLMGWGNAPPAYITNPNAGLSSGGFRSAGPQYIVNPMYSAGGGGGGNFQAVSGGGGGGGGGGFNAGTSGNVFSDFSGGGSQVFNNNAPEGMNPYQFQPTVQNLQRPNRAFLPLSDEEEAMRQYIMGSLLGARPGEDVAYNELFNTVSGDYLHPQSNPYLSEQIDVIGTESTDRLNESINQILARAGTAGAFGGSRSALMQGQAAGETGRAFDQIIADLLSSNYQRERGLQLASIPGLLEVEGMPTQRATQAMGVAGIPRGIEQQENMYRLQELMRQQNERLMPLQVGQSILGQLMGQTIPIANQGGGLAGLGSLLTGVGNLAGSSLGQNIGSGLSGAWTGLGNLLGAGGGGGSYLGSLINSPVGIGEGLAGTEDLLWGSMAEGGGELASGLMDWLSMLAA